jgi:hypothetical protein
MRPRSWRILQECVERAALGAVWNEDLTIPKNQLEAEMKAEKITDRVMVEIAEYFEFDHESD